jgi:hypothetical protein
VSGALERKKRIWHLDWTFGMSCQETMLPGMAGTPCASLVGGK